jgi:hypothetical protein
VTAVLLAAGTAGLTARGAAGHARGLSVVCIVVVVLVQVHTRVIGVVYAKFAILV